MQERVFRSSRVWNLYLDLEESLGTVETAKAAYERAMEVGAIERRSRRLLLSATRKLLYCEGGEAFVIGDLC